MGTRSMVGVMVGDKCRAVYVHWDGYLEGVGAELQGYTQQERVELLISHGDRSSLDDGYYKDRGEKGVDPTDYDTFAEFFEAVEGCWAEWYYIFKDGVWYCGNTYGGDSLYKKLTAYEDAVSIREGEETLEEEDTM
jgi:hypothetical protein